ncbi:unnamed protein product [Closterium sp. NIES-65]|nr:unnamed protein product [Closterium sp. NIES-65]
MYITLYYIVIRLPDSLRVVRDHFPQVAPTTLTVDLLEKALLAAEKRTLPVGASRGDPRTPVFEGCSSSPLLPSVASAAAADLVGFKSVGAASAPSGKRRTGKGKGGKGAGGAGEGGGGGGGGSGGSGGGGGSGAGGGGGSGSSGGGGGGDGGGGSRGGGGGGRGGGGGGGRGGSGGGGGGGAGRDSAQRSGTGGGPRQQQRSGVTLSPQQLREWYSAHQRGGGFGPCTYVLRTDDRAGEQCSGPHSTQRCFGRMTDAWRRKFPKASEIPRWGDLSRAGVAIFDLDYDAILAAMYSVTTSVEGDCYLCVPPDPGIEAAALGAGEAAALGASEAAALGASASASSGAGESALSGTASASASLTFTLDSGASRSFIRDRTTLTPLRRPLAVSLADPSGGPVFLLVVDDYSRYTTVFPLRSKGDVTEVLIVWIRAARLQLRESFGSDFPVLRLHSDRGGEFSSGRLEAFCHAQGIRQTFMLPASPQQNGIAERRIGMVMDVARTSMMHAAAPHFLWPFAVQYAAHQLNLQPLVSLPQTSPALRWTGKVGDASAFWVWGSRAFVRDLFADKLSPRAVPCVFLGFPPDAPRWQFYHPTSRWVLSSQDVTFDESVPYYRLFPCRTAPLPPPPLFLVPGPPPIEPLPPQGPAPSGVSQVDAVEPVEVAVDSGTARGVEPAGAGLGVRSLWVRSVGALGLLVWPPAVLRRGGSRSLHRSCASGLPAAEDVLQRLGVPLGLLELVLLELLAVLVLLELELVGVLALVFLLALVRVGVPLRLLVLTVLLELVVLELELLRVLALAVLLALVLLRVLELTLSELEVLLALVLTMLSELQPASPLPAPSPYTGPTRESSLTTFADPESDSLRAASPSVTHILATIVTDPSFESTAASALVGELVDFAARCRLDYAASLVAESESVRPPSVGRDYELHSLDFSTAFLQGSLHEEIWLRRPPGFTGSVPPGTQWSLRRLVYSLRQAPCKWHNTLRTTLAALGFAPSTPNPSLYLHTDTSLPPLYILVYIDDLVFATADTAGLAHVKSKVQKRHTCTDLGELRSYLGLQITRDRAERTITLTHSHMVQHVLQRFGFTYSSPQATPLSTRHPLSALPSDESVESSGPYPELVGCLMYLMTCTRPDLAYPLSILARYVAPGRHRPEHMAAAKRVLRYVCSTSGMGLVLGGRRRVVLTGHADASWADDQALQRSSQGYTFSLGSGPVSLRSTRSSSVLTSSCEAEIYAGAMAAEELCWLTYLLTDLGEPPRSPPVLYVDNKAMLALCREERLEYRTKHIALRYFLARELQQRGQLCLTYVASEANTADIFTKALPPCDHQRFCTLLGLVPIWPYLLTS